MGYVFRITSFILLILVVNYLNVGEHERLHEEACEMLGGNVTEKVVGIFNGHVICQYPLSKAEQRGEYSYQLHVAEHQIQTIMWVIFISVFVLII